MAKNTLERIVDYTIENNPNEAFQIISIHSDNWAQDTSPETIKSQLLRLIDVKGDVVTEALLDAHPDKGLFESPSSQLAVTSQIITTNQEEAMQPTGVRRYWQDSRIKLGVLLVLLIGVIALLAWKYQD
ncbi:hypothetical protein BKI52_02705 [marine bacterium AO1-C]|nr:hypothetical protein BKI52_02705 [marine bacterium AO1-C]